MAGTQKQRLDRLLVERGLAESRQKAQGLILAGQILVDDQKVEKCGALVGAQAALRMLGDTAKYVSRGGLKLEGALEHFRINPDAKVCLDIGASTGGFTDCLLQHGSGPGLCNRWRYQSARLEVAARSARHGTGKT